MFSCHMQDRQKMGTDIDSVSESALNCWMSDGSIVDENEKDDNGLDER